MIVLRIIGKAIFGAALGVIASVFWFAGLLHMLKLGTLGWPVD
jgi:hypothetical protein